MEILNVCRSLKFQLHLRQLENNQQLNNMIIPNAVLSDMEVIEINVEKLRNKYGDGLLFELKGPYVPSGYPERKYCIQILYSELLLQKDLYLMLSDRDGTLDKRLSDTDKVYKWSYDSDWENTLEKYTTKSGMSVRLLPVGALIKVDLEITNIFH